MQTTFGLETDRLPHCVVYPATRSTRICRRSCADVIGEIIGGRSSGWRGWRSPGAVVDGGRVKPTLVLLHSLLLGPLTWAPVAAKLRALGVGTVIPSMVHVTDVDEPPFWPQIGAVVKDSVSALPQDQPIVLVAHSNAGVVVPPVVAAAGRSLGACSSMPVCPRVAGRRLPPPDRLAYLRSIAAEAGCRNGRHGGKRTPSHHCFPAPGPEH